MALSPRALYRSYLKHLQHVPDPHIWRTHQPYFRSLLDRPGSGENHNDEVFRTGEGEGETSRAGALRESRRLRGLQRARKELHKLQAAVGCHPHAFRRLLLEAYGLKGRVRWELVNNIVRSGPVVETAISTEQVLPISTHPPLPAPLLPLKPPPIPPQRDPNIRLRPVPDTAIRKAFKREWDRDWRGVAVPLVLTSSPSPSSSSADGWQGWRTGWEDQGVVEGLRILAGGEPLDAKETAAIKAKAARARSALLRARAKGVQSGPDTDIDADTVTPKNRAATTWPSPSAPAPAPTPPPPPPLPLPRSLPTYAHLPPHIRLLIPRVQRKAITPENAYPSPRPGQTRANPRTWGPPRAYRPRLIRRLYQGLWRSLRWVRPKPAATAAAATGHPDEGGSMDKASDRKGAKASKASKRGRQGESRAGVKSADNEWIECDYSALIRSDAS